VSDHGHYRHQDVIDANERDRGYCETCRNADAEEYWLPVDRSRSR
jgi:hypothetical protein